MARADEIQMGPIEHPPLRNQRRVLLPIAEGEDLPEVLLADELDRGPVIDRQGRDHEDHRRPHRLGELPDAPQHGAAVSPRAVVEGRLRRVETGVKLVAPPSQAALVSGGHLTGAGLQRQGLETVAARPEADRVGAGETLRGRIENPRESTDVQLPLHERPQMTDRVAEVGQKGARASPARRGVALENERP